MCDVRCRSPPPGLLPSAWFLSFPSRHPPAPHALPLDIPHTHTLPHGISHVQRRFFKSLLLPPLPIPRLPKQTPLPRSTNNPRAQLDHQLALAAAASVARRRGLATPLAAGVESGGGGGFLPTPGASGGVKRQRDNDDDNDGGGDGGGGILTSTSTPMTTSAAAITGRSGRVVTPGVRLVTWTILPVINWQF
jgi:hypothetical protein